MLKRSLAGDGWLAGTNMMSNDLERGIPSCPTNLLYSRCLISGKGVSRGTRSKIIEELKVALIEIDPGATELEVVAIEKAAEGAVDGVNDGAVDGAVEGVGDDGRSKELRLESGVIGVLGVLGDSVS